MTRTRRILINVAIAATVGAAGVASWAFTASTVPTLEAASVTQARS